MRTYIVYAALFSFLVACSSESPPGVQTPAVPATGSDRDDHGCIPSAGYSWCEKENACVRPWELAQQRGFAPSPENFKDYCGYGVVGHAEDNADRILGPEKLAGKLDGFRWGDYLHAEIRDEKGAIQSLFVGNADACFLALHAGEHLQIEYNRVSRYFEEGGGYFPAEDITQIKARDADFRSWKKTFDSSRDNARCEKAVGQRVLKEDVSAQE